ncbi:hypothetical protein [Roseofilum casamattae]|uniref:Uncharacterized protein n=1 Tax=Roseofilum casamattae BLCC-M143 TaxID=3022442 RepID=A0ABT7BSP6_9CYAN|nr:hypothetical protein [Roseofilum casamattae]MDJ1182220.1 hypothetical protein [Roseofilum casamattae BLCC-M143]
MNYLVTVLRDRIQAEEVYCALEKEGLPLKTINILGKGYKSADEFGFIDPNQAARKQAQLMATWLMPFGFFGGITFSVISGLHTFAWAGEIGNHVVGGVLGSLSGGMGALFVGGGVGLISGSGDALPYRNRLQEGKYLIVIQGSSGLIEQATAVIRPFEPENLQGYTAPS